MIPHVRNYSKAESELLSQVDRGTPMGDMLRRYWWPINISHELKDKPTFVRFFGEDLVLFRDRQGRPGLIDAKVGDDVLKPVGPAEVGSSRCTCGAAENRGTEVVDATGTLLFERDRARDAVCRVERCKPPPHGPRRRYQAMR